MSKKQNHIGQPHPVKVADKDGNELHFPADRHVLTGRQREIPNPAGAMAGLGQPSQSAYLRAATASQDQREARARREAQQIIAAAERPAPTVREDLQAIRRRPLDAPMATPITSLPLPPAPMICGLPDPLAALAWEAVATDTEQAVRSWWERIKGPLAFVAWSIACFLLGGIARG